MMNAGHSLPNDQHVVAAGDFPAPPGANKLQLELWRRVLSHRCQQIQTLSPHNFQSYVHDGIALDMETSRLKLAEGHYSSHLIRQHPPPSNITIRDVERHIIALFYRSMDERLPGDERKYGLDAVKRSFLALDAAVKDQSLNSRNALGENQTHERNDGEDGSKSRTELPPNADKSVPLRDPSSSGEVQKEHNVNIRKEPPLSLDPNENDSMGNQMQHSSNTQGDQTSHNLSCGREVGENDSKNKRQRGPTSVRDATNEIDSLDCANEPVGKNNHTDEEEGPKNKRFREEPAPNLDASDAPKKQSQHHNTQEKQKEHTGKKYDEGEEKESNDKGQRNHTPLSETNHVQEEQSHSNVESEPDIVVIDPAPSGSMPGRRKNEGSEAGKSADISSSTDDKGPSGLSKGPSQASSTIPSGVSSSSKEQKTPPVQSSRDSLGSQPSHDIVSLTSTALPRPITHFCMRSITFLHDNYYPGPASASLKPRDSCTVSYDAGFNLDGSGSCLDDKTFSDVRERLLKWDPYWKIVKELGRQEARAADGRNKTMAAARTTACISTFNEVANNNMYDLPTSCAMVTVDIPSELIRDIASNTDGSLHTSVHNPWGLKWGSVPTYKTGERRLLLRMLPLKRCEKEEKRCDTHMWPIGTFLQLSRGVQEQVLLIAQRQQQSHDPKLWKGLCHPLDLTAILPDASSPFSLKICSKEVIERVESPKYKLGTPVRKMFQGNDGDMRPFYGTVKRYDAEFKLYQVVYEDGDAEELTDKEVANILVNNHTGDQEEGKLLHGSFAVHLAVCEYTEPEDLFGQIMGKIQKISLASSQRIARQYLENNTVSIDVDCEGDKSSSDSSLTFSLICPISKMVIETPVRGQRCKHMQCFDLKIWLQSNKHISGGRWRCGVCEDFIAARDLVRCGLFEAMLHDHRDKVSGIRDKVSFKPDGSWHMKEENRLRYSSKNQGAGDKVSGGTSAENKSMKETNDASQKRPLPQPEVIELL